MLNNDSDFHLKLAEYRRKSADGTITLDEMREAVRLMRQGRVAAAEANAKAKKAASGKPTVNAADLLSQLEGL